MATFWRDADRSPVTVQEAIGEWSLVAWDVLEEVAGRWRRTISEERLGAEVQKRSGIMTSLPTDAWLGHVLSLVAQRAHEARGAALTAFVVDESGRVPASYDEVLRLEGLGEGSSAIREQHALDARLLGHRVHLATMPAGATTDDLRGGSPRGARTTRAAAASPGRGRAATPAAPEPRKPPVCPRCFIVLPATGRCDYCS